MESQKDKSLRIVFMGTPEFAVAGLEKLVNNGYSIVGVITAPDKPAGRGRRLMESAVKQYARDKGLRLLQPTNLKDPEFLEELKSLSANLQIVVAFRMLPKVVWDMPEFGTFNLHASLLPQYRGAAPINWAIINGETETGVTTFFIDEKIDTGAMILQERTTIAADESAGELHDRLKFLGAALILKTVQAIAAGTVATINQPVTTELKSAPKLDKTNCRIDWNSSLEAVYNQIRGLSPYPAAWSILRNGEEELQVKFFQTNMEHVAHDDAIGRVLTTKKTMKITVKEGYLHVLEIQLAGKRKMKVAELLNGFEVHDNAQMV